MSKPIQQPDPKRDTVLAVQQDLSATGLATRHAFIDTQVYRELGHDLGREPLKTFASYVLAKRVVVHTTDITLAEVKRHLHEDATTLAAHVRDIDRQMNHWRGRAQDSIGRGPEPIDAEALAKSLYKKFRETLLYEWSGQSHAASTMSAEEIFKAYFERQPPFFAPKSKEFPDAFVIAAMKSWCESQNTKMYVVTADKAMRSAAQQAGRLIPIGSLAELLEIAAKEFAPDVADTAAALLEDEAILDAIGDGISEKLQDVGLSYSGDLNDGEAMEAKVNGQPELKDLTVVSASPPHIGVIAEFTVPLVVEVSFEDISGATWDSEDKVLIGGESAVTDIEVEADIQVFVSLDTIARSVHNVEITTDELDVSEPYEYG